MWINVGRLLMLGIWAFMLGNLIYTYSSPINIFINVAMIFMVFIHILQVALFNNKADIPPLLRLWRAFKLFLFGVFELLAQQKKNLPPPK